MKLQEVYQTALQQYDESDEWYEPIAKTSMSLFGKPNFGSKSCLRAIVLQLHSFVEHGEIPSKDFFNKLAESYAEASKD